MVNASKAVTIVSKNGDELTIEVTDEPRRLSFFLGQHCFVIEGFPIVDILDAIRHMAGRPTGYPPSRGGTRMSEERLEIIENRVYRENNGDGIELCREIRRLQARVAEFAEERREWLADRETEAH